MSETTTTPENNDPLDVGLGDLDTSFPKLIPDRTYKFIIRSPDIIPSKKDSNVLLLSYRLETVEDHIDTDGRPFLKGGKFADQICITPTGKLDKTNIAKSIGLLAKAVGGDDLRKLKFGEFLANPRTILPLIENKVVKCKVGMQPEKDGYPERNSFKFLVEA